MTKRLWIDIGEGEISSRARDIAIGAASQRPNCRILKEYAIDDSSYEQVTVVLQKVDNKARTICNKGSYRHVVISEA